MEARRELPDEAFVPTRLVLSDASFDELSDVGFATVAGGSLEREHMPDAALRRRLPGYPLPILRLARLGVDRRAQGMGIGSAFVRQVLLLALAQRDQVGCVGVVTDAKPGAIAFYEALGFMRLREVHEGLQPQPMFLDIGRIASAVGPGRRE